MSTYTDAVDRNLEGIQAVSSGACPGCETCRDNLGFETLDEFRKAWEEGDVSESDGFSWSPCECCGTRLGGSRSVWHAIAGQPGENLKGKEILHFDGMCTDCVLYLANGDEPENWRAR